LPDNRLEREIYELVTSARAQHRMGQVSAVVGTSKVTVTTSGGASLTVPRLATWTPAIGDNVLLAVTPAGWVAIGKVAT
jgi:hypothetical protein